LQFASNRACAFFGKLPMLRQPPNNWGAVVLIVSRASEGGRYKGKNEHR
jgi:hypothetical protein